MMVILYDVVSFVTVFCLILLHQSDAFQPCQTSKPLPNSTVHFVNPHDLVSEVCGCLEMALKFQCCMTSYTSVQWFHLKDGEWHDFLDTDRRYGEDDNQTAILKCAWDQGFDDGTYKCVGYGLSPGDKISHTLNVTLKACPNIENGPPVPFIPDSPKTDFKFSLLEIASVMCGAIFGTQCDKESGGTYCTMNWTRIGDRPRTIPECSSDDSIQGICYKNNAPRSSVNDMTTVLHIGRVTESDFGTYVCSMHNKYGTTIRTIVISEKDKIVSYVLQRVMIGILCSAVVFAVIGAIVYWHKWELRIRWNVLKHNLPGNTINKRRKNILLLHTSSTRIDQSFARYCSGKLQNFGYNVVIENDIDGGRDVIGEWHDKAKVCGSIIVLLSPDFLTDEDQRCRLPLSSIIRSEANISFLLLNVSVQHHAGFFWTDHAITDRTNDDPILTKLSKDLSVALKMKKKFEYPIPVDPNQFLDTIWGSLEVLHQNEVRAFWEKLMWSLPQQEESDPLLQTT